MNNKILEFVNHDEDDMVTCDQIIDYFETTKKRSKWQEDSFFNGRTLSQSEISDYELRRRIWVYFYKLMVITSAKYKRFVFPVFSDIVYWGKGMKMGVHTDNKDEDLKHRHYTSVTYLNSGYEGGETFLPEHDYIITPEKGKTVVFPSSYPHGVKEIIEGHRYTLMMWYTTDPKYTMIPNLDLK